MLLSFARERTTGRRRGLLRRLGRSGKDHRVAR